MQKAMTVVVAALLLVSLMALAIGCPPAEVEPVKEVTVGSKGFTEQLIVGELMKQLLEDRGFEVTLESGLSTTALRGGMEAGDIDIVAEYTGTAWMVHFGREYEPGIDNNELYRLVKEVDAGKGIVWLDPMWNNNTYALAVWPEFAAEHNLATLSDLAALYREMEGKVAMFVTLEFAARPDGLPALQEHYGFVVDEGFLMTGAAGMSLVALAERETEVGMVFGTDPAIVKHGWTVLTDDKAFFPPYDMTPSVRAEVLEKFPEIRDILNELVASFPGGGEPATAEIVAAGQRAWQELNAKVDIEGMLPSEAAREYLIEHGLIGK
ncbi:glycine/betaine ABC transporter substrate-binding protein [Dehalococcoidia bacterium]|nr:glycine/betaine ABC transporter substrate-binding protein [Dehalococcoidia bacterium]